CHRPGPCWPRRAGTGTTTASARAKAARWAMRRCAPMGPRRWPMRWNAWARRSAAKPRWPRRWRACGSDRLLQVRGHEAPVDHVPERVEIAVAGFAVVEHERVLPQVEPQQRAVLAGDGRGGVAGERHRERSAGPLQQPDPARALERGGGRGELLAEAGEIAEPPPDRLRQLVVRLAAAAGRGRLQAAPLERQVP